MDTHADQARSVEPLDVAWRMHTSAQQGLIIDLSINVIAFLLPELMENGERLALRLSNRQFGRHIETTAVVIRSCADGNHQWKIVCQFEEHLTFDQVCDFGSQLFESESV